jgi:uncharacterized protein (TIGR03435 family)
LRLIGIAALMMAVRTPAAQTPERFEVASLRPSKPGTPFRSDLDRAQFNCSAHTLIALLMSAYPDIEVQPWKLAGGPPWIFTDRWDLAAKLPPGMPADEQQLYRRTEAMLQALLAEEFHLKTHREMRDYPVYALTVGRNGPKLKPSEAARFDVKTSAGRLDFRHQSMSGLVRFLYTANAPVQRAADRPVIDRTGLDGFFDFTLEWTPDTAQADAPSTGPSIYTAIEEQLGLKLQPQKARIEFLVVDHVEKPARN